MSRLLFATLAAVVAVEATIVLTQDAPAAFTCDRNNDGLKLPAGFCAVVAAKTGGVGRHMTVAPNGDLFLSLRAPRDGGGIVALRDTNGDGVFDVERRFGDSGGTGIALRPGFLYHAQDQAIVRYPLREGEMVPAGPAETVVHLPEQSGHAAKGLAFDDRGGLYVNVGAPSNACQEKDRVPGSVGQMPCPLLENHAGVWRIGQSQDVGGRRYATGMRQFYALTWHRGFLWAVQHGRDQLSTLYPESFDARQNAELPSEELLRIDKDSDFGWPYCYHDWRQGIRVQSPEYGGDGKTIGDCAKYPTPSAAFPGHWAPGSVVFYSGRQFPPRYRGGAFIAFQGSWNRAPEPAGGYKVVFQPFEATRRSRLYEVFADGFAGRVPLMRREDARARPSGLAVAPDGSMYVSDMVEGKIWRIVYRGAR